MHYQPSHFNISRISFLIGIILILSCQKDDDVVSTPNSQSGTGKINTSIAGLVVNENGIPVENG